MLQGLTIGTKEYYKVENPPYGNSLLRLTDHYSTQNYAPIA